ncbi:MAG: flagellar protein FlgN [Verrucomicrobia bacterium]|nr:flagellar protein FlgN [Verrucomicrobiota bacterium]
MSTVHWEIIAACLREELADYGNLLRLYALQQERLFARDASAVAQVGTEIEAQAHALGSSRLRREQAVAAFAAALDRPPSSSLRSLLPCIEADARPLLEALIGEVNLLLHRLRRTSRHNHTLLARAVEVHQETLSLLRPNSFTRTYSPAGRMSLTTASPASTLRAAG